MPKKPLPYGLWTSAITPTSLARGIRFSDLAWDSSGALVWLEGRAERSVLVVQPPDRQAPRDLNSDYSVRARLGYGGGDFTTGNGHVFFVEAASGRLYRQPVASGTASPVTPAFGGAASPVLSPDGRWLVFVHTYEDSDSLGIVDAAGGFWPHRLVSGEDFYMQPSWHPESRHLAWVAWNHPNMPWDGTFLRMGSLQFSQLGLPVIEKTETLAGDEETAIFQPTFSPDGRYLAYVSDSSGWWHLNIYDLTSGKHRPLTSGEAEHGMPAWVQGMRTYAFSPDSRWVAIVRNQNGFASLWKINITTGQEEPLPLAEEYTWLDQPAIAPDGKHIAALASGSQTPARVVVFPLHGEMRILRRSMSEDLPADTYSPPQAITWNGMDGGLAHGLFYPPHNPNYQSDGLPPVIVLVHGGPTSQRTTSFDAQVQFFTSRGYAVLQVNHRGSSGYGRLYRNMLRGNWGIFDVQDSVSGVRYLAEKGLIDLKRAVIMGGSAGGFTVLQALVDYPGFFKAAINLFGVSNQFGLAMDTHKFEAHYSDSLLGPLPEAAPIYRQRSPLFSAEKIQDPMAIFQGDEDRVVPRVQSDDLVAVLRRRGVPHVYHVYPGEGHGFRKSETIEHMYTEIERFLKQYVLFA